MSTIHQRVRAAAEKREKDAQRKVDRAHDARLRRLERAELKKEAEIDRRIADGQEFDHELGMWI